MTRRAGQGGAARSNRVRFLSARGEQGERVCERELPDLASAGDVASLARTLELFVKGPLRRHEQMFHTDEIGGDAVSPTRWFSLQTTWGA